MSTVIACYTPVSRSLALPAAAASSSMQPRRSSRSVVMFPSSVAVKCRRPLAVTCALPERPAFSIPPTVLLGPVPAPDRNERWTITESTEEVKLQFQVPGLSEKDIEVAVGEDILEIRRIFGGKTADDGSHGLGSFHVRLLLTKEYDREGVSVELSSGMLEVTLRKSNESRKVVFGPNKIDNSKITGQAQSKQSAKQQERGDNRTPQSPTQPKSDPGAGRR